MCNPIVRSERTMEPQRRSLTPTISWALLIVLFSLEAHQAQARGDHGLAEGAVPGCVHVLLVVLEAHAEGGAAAAGAAAGGHGVGVLGGGGGAAAPVGVDAAGVAERAEAELEHALALGGDLKILNG